MRKKCLQSREKSGDCVRWRERGKRKKEEKGKRKKEEKGKRGERGERKNEEREGEGWNEESGIRKVFWTWTESAIFTLFSINETREYFLFVFHTFCILMRSNFNLLYRSPFLSCINSLSSESALFVAHLLFPSLGLTLPLSSLFTSFIFSIPLPLLPIFLFSFFSSPFPQSTRKILLFSHLKSSHEIPRRSFHCFFRKVFPSFLSSLSLFFFLSILSFLPPL